MDDEIIQIVDDKYDKDDVDNKIAPHNSHNPRDPHNGKKVSLISLSPNGKYVVTYSKDDNSIEGWIVNDLELILDPEANAYKLPEESKNFYAIKVNDSKIGCYIEYYGIKLFQMSNEHQQIKLNPPPKVWQPRINFEKNGNLVIFNNDKILVYPTHDEMNELNLMSSYELSSYNEIIAGVSIDEDIWVISPNYLFHWDLEAFRLENSYSLGFTVSSNNIGYMLTVISKGDLIVLKHNDEIAIFSKGVHFPIRNIKLEDTNMKIELCEVQNNAYLLVFNWPENDEKQDIILYHLTDINKQPVDASMIFNEDSENDSEKKFILYEYNSESKKAFGLVNGKFSYRNLSNLNWNKFFEAHYDEKNDDIVGWNNYLNQTYEINNYNDTLVFLDMENIRSLLSDEWERVCYRQEDISFISQKCKWRIVPWNKKLSVYTDEEVLLCSSDIVYEMREPSCKILSNNALALRENKNIIIYEYDINNNNIEIQYRFYKKNGLNIKEFSEPILPILITSVKIVRSIIEDDRCLAKYGPTLLHTLIKSSKPELTRYIEDIYNKCTKLVKEDPKRNLKFLNIITLSMSDLYKKYPDYVTKFNSEMFMILDPFSDKIVDNNSSHSHFYAFSREVRIRNTTRKIARNTTREIIRNTTRKIIRKLKLPYVIEVIVDLFLWPVLIVLIPLYSIITGLYKILYKKYNKYKNYYNEQRKQQIVLIVPYIDYSRYPLEYRWWKEIFYPQSSVFVNTCKKEFYTNWNGEAIINFKWKTFGRAYYFIIWLLFMVFLICFTIASYPTNFITQEVRINLYQTSIAFGFFHLIFELRQFVWNPRKYFLRIWNLFGERILNFISKFISCT
jgi:hypothetical protein